MVYSDLSERYIPRTEDHYSRLLDVPDSSSSPPVYSDMWRSCTPEKPETSRTSPECANGSYPGPGNGYDVENFTNVITFSPCTPSYKDFTLLKDKSGHDVTDALLSLKNAVVHPSYGSQLSPLSPTMHLGPITPAGLPGSMNVPSQQPLTYTVNHSTQVHPMGYSGRASPQFPAVQIHSDHLNPHGHHHQQHGMFPSMSVNVSMSMNVVPPNFGNNQCNQAQQWQPQPAAQHYGIAHEYPHMPQDSLQPQYSPYSQNYYTSSYSLAPEFRSSVSESRNLYYKMADDFKTSPRFYNPGHIKRSKFIDEKPMGLGSHSPDNSKLNLCRICGKTYARPSTLKTHLRTHSGEKPYKCNACSKSFSQAANLTAHARTHSGEKPFHCPVCDRHFSQSSSVTTHMRTHSGERPYRCRLCKKAFSDSSTLTKHLRIHSGEKPYQCKLCLLRFSQSGNLNRHMRVHSNNG